MSSEWFRRKTWTAEDRAAFLGRLKRVRSSSNKAQYLRIQAIHLKEEGLFRAALELLDTLVTEVPERIQLASAHLQRAECLTALFRHDEAIVAYREACAAERALPNVRTDGYLGFGELTLGLRREELYDEVLALIAEFGGKEAFPIQQYRYFVILAFIGEARGEAISAGRYARQALEAAQKTESPFRYHRGVGLVGEQRTDVQARLARLAAAVP